MIPRPLSLVAAAWLLCTAAPAFGTPASVVPEDRVPSQTVSEAEAVVDSQLDAYNRRDLEGFLAHYADDAVLVDYPDKVTQAGKDAMRARYAARFEVAGLQASIEKRIVFGNFVVDHERITNAAGESFEAMAIYEVKAGKIARVTFIRK